MKLLIDTRPLRSSPHFRRVWVGNVLSMVGGQLTVVAVLYQTWELTADPVAVGAIGLAQAVPLVLMGQVGGVLADAVDRRRLVVATSLGQVVVTALLAAQAFAGLGSLAVLLGLVALQSAGAALGTPARRTFAARLLPADQIGAGLALINLGFHVSLLVGPAIAGFVVAGWGTGACYAVNALTFFASLYGVLRLPPLPPDGTAARPGLRAVVAGWRFIVSRPVLAGAFLTDLIATVLAMPISLFPVVNAEQFGGDPQTLGLFLSAIAVGGITAGLASGMATRSRRPGRVMLVAAGMWGLALAAFGWAPSVWLALACLAVAGAADTISVISRGALVQLVTPDDYRGRVSAVEDVVGMAGPHLGNFRAGLVAGATSAGVAAVSGGVLCVLGVAAVAVVTPALRRPVRPGKPHSSPVGP
ncbi:MFS transporter [Pseudonocardia zijingensis]|uniref:MFS transporter n=1 Tax=Pseudonocardia zijingensis TaxID=153376 RepID=A0ABN1QJ93_9PSEU